MTVCLNGRFVDEAEATVSVFDRGFLYGDGLFETLRVANAKPFRWAAHLVRLEAGAAFLGIRLPFARDALAGFAADLIARNGLSEGVLRLTVSRGVGARGYSPRGAGRPTLVMTLHPLPAPPGAGWRLITSTFRLPAGERLARFKTANKLPQILARAEADAAGADEAVLLNSEGFVAEAASGNLFAVVGDAVHTPPSDAGLLPGVTRGVVLELCAALGLATREASLSPAALGGAAGVFLTLSSLGVVEAVALDGAPLGRSPITARLHAAHDALVRRECA